MLESYRRHNAEVIEYFKNRPCDLLIMNMETSGWRELCPFVDKLVPARDYPHEYKSRIRLYGGGSGI